MKKILLLLGVLLSFTKVTFAQLNFGIEFTHSINTITNDPLNIGLNPSAKSIAFLTYTNKLFYTELFTSWDAIELENSNTYFSNSFTDFGLLLGINKIFKNGTSFVTGFGAYYRNNSAFNISHQNGNRIGLTGKIQFGLQVNNSISTALVFRVLQDIYKSDSALDQILMNQNVIGFSFNVSLSEVFRKK